VRLFVDQDESAHLPVVWDSDNHQRYAVTVCRRSTHTRDESGSTVARMCSSPARTSTSINARVLLRNGAPVDPWRRSKYFTDVCNQTTMNCSFCRHFQIGIALHYSEGDRERSRAEHFPEKDHENRAGYRRCLYRTLGCIFVRTINAANVER
jgi:hypothetical protein